MKEYEDIRLLESYLTLLSNSYTQEFIIQKRSIIHNLIGVGVGVGVPK
jgi:hypothetical protein